MKQLNAIALSLLMFMSVLTAGIEMGSVVASAGNAPAGDNPFEITNRTTISEPGVYHVTADITADTLDGIIVNSSDVVIDGNGHVIDGVSGDEEARHTDKYGIHVELGNGETVSNVTIRNLVIKRWGHGLHFSNGDDLKVEDVTFEENRVGLYAESVTALDVTDSEFDSSVKHGVRLKWSDDATFTANTFVDQGHRGIHSTGSVKVTVSGNTFTGDQIGVRLHKADESAVENNQFDVEDTGIDVTGSENTSVVGNDITAKESGVRVGKRGQHADEKTDQGSSGSSDDHSHDDGSSDDHTHEDDSHDDHDHEDGDSCEDCGGEDDSHSDSDGHDDTGTDVPGPIEVKDNVIDAADKGILLDAVREVKIANNTYQNIKSWTVYSANGSVVSDSTWLTFQGTRVSFTGRDVALHSVDEVPTDPEGFTNIGKFVAVSMTSDDAWINLAFPYAPGDVPAGENAEDLRVWRHDGDGWDLAEPPTWFQDGSGVWAASDAGSVDTDARIVSANSSATDGAAEAPVSMIYGPIVGPTDSLEVVPRIENASLNRTTVHQGETVSVSADVNNDAAASAVIDVQLTVDGTARASRLARVDAASSQMVTFDLTAQDLGSHEIEVAGVSAGTLTVFEATAPIANAGDDRSVKVGQTIQFDGSESSDNVGIVDYAWDFGDGTTATGATASHAYQTAGTYEVTLTVRDEAGNANSDVVTVTVTKPESSSGGSTISAGLGDGGSSSTGAAGTEVRQRVRISPTQGGGAEAFVGAIAGVPNTLDLDRLGTDPDSGVRLESIEMTTTRDMEFYLRASTNVMGQPGKPAFDANLGEPMEYIEFAHSFEDEAIEGVTFTFAVEKNRLQYPDLLDLYRYHGGEWQPVEIDLVSESGSAYVFEASPPGLSVFALVVDPQSEFGMVGHGMETDQIDPGDHLRFGATVHNPYRAAMSIEVPLRLDGNVVASERVTIAPDQTAQVTIDYRFGEVGVYSVSIGSERVGTVDVGMPDEPTPIYPEIRVGSGAEVDGPTGDTPAGDADTSAGVELGGLTTPVIVAVILAVVLVVIIGFRRLR